VALPLQLTAHRVFAAYLADLELADQTRQLLRLLRQRMAGRCRLLDHGCVLLRHLIHLGDGRVDFAKPDRLLFRARGYLGDNRGDLTHLPMIRSSDLPVSFTSLTPFSTCVDDAKISPLISFAASAER